MVGVEPEIGSSVLRLWIAVAAAAALVAVCALVFARLRTNAANAAVATGIVAVGAVLGAAMAWALLSQPSVPGYDTGRRALEARAQELNERALAPGSSLACLDALAGDNVVSAC